ncbi:MAG: D-aminoacylase [Dehalococcoidia bacterium]
MPEQYDLIIRDGTVYDGSGAPGIDADVGVRGDVIAAVGDLGDATGGEEIAAAGHAVVPGFIDVHSHDDNLVLVEPDVTGKTMQGVTTVVVGNCGSGVVPYQRARDGLMRALDVPEDFPTWSSYPEYLDVIDAHPPSLNVATLVGHGTLRSGAMGGPGERRPPSADELTRMRAWLAEGLEAGAVGVSTGLIYEPGRYTETEELIEMARECARIGGLYASHIRGEGGTLLDAVSEAIRIGEEAGCPVEISHHKATGEANWGRVKDSLALIEQARSRGLDVTADQYPYIASSTGLAAIALNARESGAGLRGETIFIASAPRTPEHEGKYLSAIADELDLPLEDAIDRLLGDNSRTVTIVAFGMDEADVRTVLRHESTMIGTDGLGWGSRPHPRHFGTYPRILAHYVREEGVLTLEEAIHKMTGMPAQKFRLTDRGHVREGFAADLVVFDPSAIVDNATYEDPRNAPTAMPHVFVNGAAVVRDGEHTHARVGRALRRGGS